MFDPSCVRKGQFDVAIIAIGSSPSRPNIPGVERNQVITARDFLEGWAEAKGKVVVAGGGCMGAQVAEVLAVNKYPVTIVEARDAIAADAPIDDGALLIERLKKLKVKVLTGHTIQGIGTSSVIVSGKNGEKTIPAHTVVMCLGSRSNDGLAEEVKTLVKQVFVVGDARKPGRVTDAVADGALIALKI